MTIDTLRNQFPQLSETAYGKPLVYLDNAATSLRPVSVVECIKEASFRKNSNIHRSVHYFSTVATDSFESARTAVADFVGAGDPAEIVFTSGATASLNLVSSSLGDLLLEKGDEVIVLESEHHSNIVPWQLACRKNGAVIKVLGVDEYGCFSLEELESLITDRTRIFCFAHASNVLGLLNPVREAVALCRSKGVVTVVDGSQAIVHTEVDVKNLDVDFYAFSGHKIYAATGTGVLYGKRHLLEKMPPYMSGGEMISSVSWEETTFNSVPFKFEAGTPNFLGVPTLVPAIGMLQAMRRDGFESGLRSVVEYLLEELPKIDGLKLYGVPRGTFTKLPIFSFTVDGAHHEDIAFLLDKMGVAVRSGQMCAEPLMDRFGVTGMVRASFAPYNTLSEAEYFVACLRRAIEMLK